MTIREALNAVQEYLTKKNFHVETGPGRDGREIVRASEGGKILGSIAIDQSYVEDVSGADAIKIHLARQQAAEWLRMRRPAERGKYLLLGMAGGEPWLEERD